jgi:DNA repair protein RAD50
MKYHSLKMEEVNDTMRHLWNKTYQGTGVYIVTSCNLCDLTRPSPKTSMEFAFDMIAKAAPLSDHITTE